jgi:hypothetical protein
MREAQAPTTESVQLPFRDSPASASGPSGDHDEERDQFASSVFGKHFRSRAQVMHPRELEEKIGGSDLGGQGQSRAIRAPYPAYILTRSVVTRVKAARSRS